jgi:hypothetical protein
MEEDLWRILTLSDPISDLVRHYDFLFPTLFMIFNHFQSNFSATRILTPQLLFILGGKEVGGLLVINLQF